MKKIIILCLIAIGVAGQLNAQGIDKLREKFIAFTQVSEGARRLENAVKIHREKTGMDYKLADILTVDDLKRVKEWTGENILFLLREGYNNEQIIQIIDKSSIDYIFYRAKPCSNWRAFEEDIIAAGGTGELIKKLEGTKYGERVQMAYPLLIFWGILIVPCILFKTVAWMENKIKNK